MKTLMLLMLTISPLFAETLQLHEWAEDEKVQRRVKAVAMPFFMALNQEPAAAINLVMNNSSKARQESKNYLHKVRSLMTDLAQFGENSDIEMEFYAFTNVAADYRTFHYVIKTDNGVMQGNVSYYVFQDAVLFEQMGFTTSREEMLKNTEYATRFDRTFTIFFKDKKTE